ncbi:hypothetical protein XENTR_v10019956 [Xenopus tropicalis]|nr:hypothetical protein XENTR_v10019956 [Xenopus tropicalis]
MPFYCYVGRESAPHCVSSAISSPLYFTDNTHAGTSAVNIPPPPPSRGGQYHQNQPLYCQNHPRSFGSDSEEVRMYIV